MYSLLVPFLELKLDEAEPGSFKGYGSTFGNVDLGKDVCAAGCFSRTLKEMGDAKPAMYWMHDRKLPIGDWTSVEEDKRGLKMTGKLWVGKGIPEAEKAYTMLKGTGPKGLSIGFIPKVAEWDDKKGIRTLKDVDLPEVSVVGYGMNPKALVTSVKLFDEKSLPDRFELERLLRDAGLSASQVKALFSHGYEGLNADPSVPCLKSIQRLFAKP